MRINKLAGALAIAGLATVSGAAFATNGYFSHGYGMKAKGMAGAGIAFGQDALAAATNPANMVLVGDRLDVGLDWFRPQRSTVTGTVTHDGNGKEDFFIPEFGYNKMLNQNMSLGVSVFGNGGMNTQYNSYNATAGVFAFGSGDPVGVDLSQLFISPTFAMKINDVHSVGVSLNVAYQRFKAYGLSGFNVAAQTSAVGSVTDNGYDNSWGYGARIGWTGKLNADWTVGATYQTRTHMGKFDKYKGLFAEQGDFDIPANFGFGAAVKITPSLTAAVDLMRIQYGSVKAISNTNAQGGLLGANNGSGFGWTDQTIFKLGLSYEYSKNLTLRAGWNSGETPYDPGQTQFNTLAPAVVEDHITLGGTWTLDNKSEISVAYMHAFSNQVSGTNTMTNRMYQDSLGVSYGMKF
ncbi:MAG: outer membrane protein transport protein [Hydrogenophilales bacterium]|nr:outer membrane protein transport protein [Hydrogenophilales bacterium]